ncbi:hypothetical protein EVAR_36904_1 [Eumeta japonica]|uniref:Uncharacterized protein n=1 Tax=Eumeta variegata TaxID=151549 RepID=A0A4C1WRX4_EUMVA|nr:hypothetical protein EVAR_36904_1 [Eumeta japonica]
MQCVRLFFASKPKEWFYQDPRELAEYLLKYKALQREHITIARRGREPAQKNNGGRGKTYGQRQDNKALYFHSNPGRAGGARGAGRGARYLKLQAYGECLLGARRNSIPLCLSATFRYTLLRPTCTLEISLRTDFN